MPIPSKITIRKQSRCLELEYEGEKVFQLSFEFLRVHSPSAEVQGHGPGTAVLQYGKRDVALDKIEPVGNYGLKFIFDDGHDSGIYTWDTLTRFCHNQAALWSEYLAKIEEAGMSREPSPS